MRACARAGAGVTRDPLGPWSRSSAATGTWSRSSAGCSGGSYPVSPRVSTLCARARARPTIHVKLPPKSHQQERAVRITCADCPKTFRTPTGLDWHQQHMHNTPVAPADPIPIIPPEANQPRQQIKLERSNPAPTAPGDYNCMDCLGANNVGGFYLIGAVAHYRETGHRLKHIPGSENF